MVDFSNLPIFKARIQEVLPAFIPGFVQASGKYLTVSSKKQFLMKENNLTNPEIKKIL